MDNKIKSITESFSMQPCTWSVAERGKRQDLPSSYNIAEIKLERIGPDEFYDYLYKAYDFDGRLIYQWQPKAENVEYF